jgi:hypothetical protein
VLILFTVFEWTRTEQHINEKKHKVAENSMKAARIGPNFDHGGNYPRIFHEERLAHDADQ